MLKNLRRSGVRYGVSSRGTGVVSEGMVSNFSLQTIDLVATPSAHGAYPTTMYEALEEQKGRKVLTLAEAVREDPNAQKYFESEVKKFLQSLIKK